MIKNSQQGQTIIIAALVIMLVSAIVLATVAPVAASQLQRTADLNRSKQSLYVAEAGLGDVVYRLSSGWEVDQVESYDLAEAEVEITTEQLAGGLTRVTAIGDLNNRIRVMEAELTVGTGVAFNYGIQAGQGGFELSGSSGVIGNVYSNNDILGSGASFITGSAIAAGSPEIWLGAGNEESAELTTDLQFGQAKETEDVAIKFSTTETDFLNSIEVYLKQEGNPSDLTAKIVLDENNQPGTTVIAQANLNQSEVNSDYDWITVEFNNQPALFADEAYWLVLDGGSHHSRFYYWGAGTGSVVMTGQYGGDWIVISEVEAYYRINLGGKNSLISDSKIGTDGEGDAHAYTVNNSEVEGNLYCQEGSGNNKTCDTSQTLPEPEPFPIEQSQIDFWKSQAEAGEVIAGDVSVGGVDQTELGPAKIEGNLSINNSGVLTVTGTLWVTGDISLTGSAKLKLDPLYGSDSGVVIADGRVTLGGSAPVEGSGHSDSYILLLTTSMCPLGLDCGNGSAVNITGASGAIILNAQKGTINFSGSAHANEATAHRITMSGATTVTYDSGLANINFTSGPSGGPAVVRWREVE
ncbi:MAG: hypothetical protein ACOCU8_02430 [Patescibacteria group bacterium]